MAANAKEQWLAAQQLHRDLRTKLKEKESLIGDIEDLISELRVACNNTIFADFEYATNEGVETALWEAHSSINKRYRKIVARFKTPEHRKSAVERRKWEKRYADFLKLSQYFYKGYIQRLASHFKGLDELRIIAHRLTLSTLSIDPPVAVSEDVAHLILLSCHSTLLRLGDLYRYRNELNTKDRSWEKANAHYGLANDLYPDSGSAFNQMAVISLADGNHLDAVYNLYRALAVKEPHPLAQSNLAIEFKKITGLWLGAGQKKASSGSRSTNNSPTASMVLWFVRLHAQLYKGEEFPNHDELENEVLSQMTVLLKEQSLEGILDRIVLINIAAEYFAGVRLGEAEDDETSETSVQAYYFFLRLNIRMLFMLLQLLQPELDDANHGNNAPDVTEKGKQNSTESITAVTRRILPALRQYSTWLVATAPVIAAQVGTAPINVHIREMWSMYCTTLSLLVAVFPVAELPDIDYLLEEDSATVGFKPFRDSSLCRIYTNSEDKVKKRSTDPGVERNHPNVEMAARIREILRDGMVLATNDQYPVYAVDGQFRFYEDGLPATLPVASPVMQLSDMETNTNSGYSYMSGHQRVSQLNSEFKGPPSVDPSESHQSLSTDMYQMVDDLLTPSKIDANSNINDSTETSYGMHTNTALEVMEHVHGMNQECYHQTPPRISGFPGFSPSPFSPRPGELQGPRNERKPISGSMTTLNNNIPAERYARIGNSSNSHGNWDKNDSANTAVQRGRPPFNVAQQVQQSLEAQYQSSAFSNSSSIYQNTPTFQPSCPNGRAGYNVPRNSESVYGVRSEYEKQAMLQSSAWSGGQPAAYAHNAPTPPSGQGS